MLLEMAYAAAGAVAGRRPAVVRLAIAALSPLCAAGAGRCQPCSPAVAAPTVYLSPAVSGPMAAGIFKRRIFLPLDFRTRYTPAEQRLALLHEGAHHDRGDLIANFAGLAVVALHWWNPVAHIAWRAFRADQELACDATVLAGDADRAAYGSAVLKSACDRAPTAACAMNQKRQLKQRITMMKTTPMGARRRAAGGTDDRRADRRRPDAHRVRQAGGTACAAQPAGAARSCSTAGTAVDAGGRVADGSTRSAQRAGAADTPGTARGADKGRRRRCRYTRRCRCRRCRDPRRRRCGGCCNPCRRRCRGCRDPRCRRCGGCRRRRCRRSGRRRRPHCHHFACKDARQHGRQLRPRRASPIAANADWEDLALCGSQAVQGRSSPRVSTPRSPPPRRACAPTSSSDASIRRQVLAEVDAAMRSVDRELAADSSAESSQLRWLTFTAPRAKDAPNNLGEHWRWPDKQ